VAVAVGASNGAKRPKKEFDLEDRGRSCGSEIIGREGAVKEEEARTGEGAGAGVG
jgi:hypothetical protein